jgi:hypothetical protein
MGKILKMILEDILDLYILKMTLEYILDLYI